MTWWPVAWSDDLARQPLAVRVGQSPIVLFRDAVGIPFGFEDRCPHRRVPLSLGKVRPDGALQCGYHGWTFAGGTGRCVLIPNFRPDEPISERVVVRTYRTSELQSVIFVETEPLLSGVGQERPPLLETRTAGQGGGRASVALPHDQWIESLLANPEGALGLREFCRFGEPTSIDVRDNEALISQPIALTSGTQGEAAVCHTKIFRGSGLVELIATRGRHGAVFSLVIASVPLSESETSVRWKVFNHKPRTMLSRILKSSVGELLIRINSECAPASGGTGEPVAAWRELSKRQLPLTGVLS